MIQSSQLNDFSMTASSPPEICIPSRSVGGIVFVYYSIRSSYRIVSNVLMSFIIFTNK